MTKRTPHRYLARWTAACAVTATLLASCGGSKGLEAVAGKFRIGGKIVAQSIDVGATHVYAVSPEADLVDRILAPLDAEGKFVLDLNLGRSYVLGVIDSTKTGALMVRGYIDVGGVHAFPVEVEGVFDMGAIAQRDGSTWTSEFAPTKGFLTQLGVSSTVATMLAAQDGLALRLLNPDVDNNGTLDLNETGKSFLADVLVRFEAQKVGAVVASVDDIRLGAVPAITNFALDSALASPVVASFGYFTTNSETSTTLRYIDAEGVVTKISPTGFPDLNTDTDGTFGAGAWSGGSAFQALELALQPTSDLPRGEIRVAFAPSSTRLTFFPMLPQTGADFRQGYNHAFAYVYLSETGGVGACASAPCTFVSLGYRWRVATDTGVRDATLTDLHGLVSSRGASFKFTVGLTDEVSIAIPTNAVEGTIAWDPMNANLGNVTGTNFLALTRTNLCNTRVEHFDRFGLRYRYRIAKAALATSCP